MAAAAPTRRVFLIGFMGAGKTSVGKKLAHSLGWKFQDLDHFIEQRQGKSVARIFTDDGEAVFRRIENAALQKLLDESHSQELVVALGGGAFVQPDNREIIRRSGGATVLLEAPLAELRRRCRQDGNIRPLAQKEEEFVKLFENRRASYALAQFRVTTMGKTIEEAAVEIQRILQGVDQGLRTREASHPLEVIE